jgi:hypothetical protein
MIIHKQGRKTATVYAGFGHYREAPSPLCTGSRVVYEGKQYWMHRLWKNVTCKNCLKKKNKED